MAAARGGVGVAHPVALAKGVRETDLRASFNTACARVLGVLRGETGRGAACGPLAAAAMSWLTVRLDSADLDFLASWSLHTMLEEVWQGIEAAARANDGSCGEAAAAARASDAFGALLTSWLDQLARLADQANPIFSAAVLDADLTALGRCAALCAGDPGSLAGSALSHGSCVRGVRVAFGWCVCMRACVVFVEYLSWSDPGFFAGCSLSHCPSPSYRPAAWGQTVSCMSCVPCVFA